MVNLSLDEFLARLASADPTPGGGSVAAVTGALAAGLGTMVCCLTIGKKKYAAWEAELRAVRERCETLRATLQEQIQADVDAFEQLAAAYRVPPGAPQREAVLQAALGPATEVPLRIAEAAAAVIDLVPVIVEKGSTLAVSDAGMAALLAAAALRSAALNVYINLRADADPHRAANHRARLEAALGDRVAAAEALYGVVAARLGGGT
ncbi:MAG: cyclodeaminase/cyclohydrolase family protein [Fimbriimonadaceae bacterium]|nr:cyclodeaminase/cyclohydrolase family protein [Fimbriimonadaceae bacterium]